METRFALLSSFQLLFQAVLTCGSSHVHRSVLREIPLLAGLKSLWRQELLLVHADPESSVTVHRVSEESCGVIVILGM